MAEDITPSQMTDKLATALSQKIVILEKLIQYTFSLLIKVA